MRLLQEYDRSGDGLLSLHEFGGLVRQLYLPCTSPIPPLFLHVISPIPPLYLPYISLISPLYLPYQVRQLVDGAAAHPGEGAAGASAAAPGVRPGWTLYLSTRLLPPHLAADSMAQLTPVDCLLDAAGVGAAIAEEALCAEAAPLLA